jgi:curved DNA-binding protein CbpA
MGPAKDRGDPWKNVPDLKGTLHYEILAVSRDATGAQIKAAYRAAARAHHPDKGGDAATFAKVQLAFEVLGNKPKRATYDALAAEHAYRYIPGGGVGTFFVLVFFLFFSF